MENNRLYYNEIITDHNARPWHKHDLPDANLELRGVNPSCGDKITLKLKVEDGVIRDGAFTGDGCAISQASADMMLDLVIGRSEAEARHLSALFLRMIKGKVTEAELEELEEASSLIDVSHMPARVKCAVLGWHTMETLLDGPGDENAVTTENDGTSKDPSAADGLGSHPAGSPGAADGPETADSPVPIAAGAFGGTADGA